MTTLVRWEPFRELTSLQQELGRYINGLSQLPTRGSQTWLPPVDVWETDTELVYAFDVPGVPEDKLSIEVHDDTLTISGERTRTSDANGDHFYRFERQFGAFARGVGLPQGVDDSNISANYQDGVLEVHVPKPEEAKPRRIRLGAADKQDLEAVSS